MDESHLDEHTIPLMHDCVKEAGGDPNSFEGGLIVQMMQSCLKLISDEHTTAQLKLINRALKEMRYAYRIFNQYPSSKRLSIFGSARTPETHPDYIQAKKFSAAMEEKGWMCITGAANGIMKAGHEGSKRDASFGLSIRLAFESNPNPFLEGDPKLINFRYFFTRKLMFMSHSDAIAVFPGGVGTMDELFEVLTLMQTGKSGIIPVVLLEGEGGTYWINWLKYFEENLLKNGWVSPEDLHFFHVCNTAEEAVEVIERFYKRFHSFRYVKDQLVFRLKSPLSHDQLKEVNKKFAFLVKEREMIQSDALPEEDDFLDLPRLVFTHTRRDWGLVKALIDQINLY